MKSNSILLALSGSQQSRYAAETCWRLAKILSAKITAVHVVDTHNAWQFIGHDKPGFVKSEEYVAAFQSLCKSMYLLGENLLDRYTDEARKRGLDERCFIDDGNPLARICNRADDHNLVVIGHKPDLGGQTDTVNGEFIRLSLAESLALLCPRPLLIVQRPSSFWSSLAITISTDHINEQFINSCLDLADLLDLPAAILCVRCGGAEGNPIQFVSALKEANPRLAKVPIAITAGSESLEVVPESWYLTEGEDFDNRILDNALIVMPTRNGGANRLTVLDSSPALFVRYLKLSSILLWPEEFAFTFADLRPDQALSAAGPKV